ncbi:Fungal Zn(2)-Cys(6) binuclear cluster domain [Ceratobasidium sp. AG-Ba]|nr:Fungal Zn(2)-Cys(6) binuclear cluster domain [Ceratobasidium sp. AG-Ba]
MGGDHMCPVCSATFTRPQHVARHMRSHTGDRPYGCQMCGDRFARSDLLSRHVNKCHTPGGLTNTTTRKGQSSRAQAAEDKKRRPCEACTLDSTKCDFGKPCNNCTSRGTKCAYPKAKRARRDTNPSPSRPLTNLPPTNPQGTQESLPMSSFGTGYQEDITPFNFSYPPSDPSMNMPHLFEPPLSVPGPNSNAFMGSPDAPSLSFSAATSDSTESSPWNPLEYMGMAGSISANGLDASNFHDPNAPSFMSAHKLQSQANHPFTYSIDHAQYDQPLTNLHQRPGSAVQRHPPNHHQRHRSTPSLDGQQPLLNSTLLRAQAQQYPAITPNRLYMHRGSISASDSGTDYESSSGRPGTAGGYSDYPSPMSVTNSETGSVGQGVGHALDDMSLHDPGNNNILSMGSVIVPGIGMGTGLTPAVESPSRPSMMQRQSTFGDLRAFWNEVNDKPNVGNMHGNSNENRHSLTKMTSMPCLKTPLGDATPRAASHDPLSRLGQKGNNSSLHTPRVINHTDPKSLEQYQHAIDARQPPSLQIAPKMKAAAAKQEDTDLNTKQDSFATPFPPGSAQADAWSSLMTGASRNNKLNGGSYVADSGRPNYKRLPSQTLGPENSKRAHHDESETDSAVHTDDDDEEEYKQAQQEWHRRMSLPAGIGRSSGRLYQPQPVPVPSPRMG